MTRRSRVIFMIPTLALLAVLGLQAEASDTAFTAKVDWLKDEFVLKVETQTPRSGFNAPTADLAAQRKIEQTLPRLFQEAVADVLVDSVSRVGDLLARDPSLAVELLDVGGRAKRGLPAPSSDLGKVFTTYAYPLHETLGAALRSHGNPSMVPKKLSWEPSANFSGLVIFAKGDLPIHGERRDGKLVPCLFPKIFDENMNPVLFPDMTNPDYLRRWGSLAYAVSFDEKAWDSRIGKTPLRILARGLYGKNPTDLKIHPQDAAKLLANANNRKILAEGRVLVIIDPPEGADR